MRAAKARAASHLQRNDKRNDVRLGYVKFLDKIGLYRRARGARDEGPAARRSAVGTVIVQIMNLPDFACKDQQQYIPSVRLSGLKCP